MISSKDKPYYYSIVLGEVNIFTRNHKDITHLLPDIVEGVQSCPHSFILDVELVAVDRVTREPLRISALQEYMGERRKRLGL